MEKARQAYAAIGRGDIDAFLALIDPDVEFRSLIGEMEGGTYRGHEGVREWWGAIRESLGGLRWQLQRVEDMGGDATLVKMVVTGEVAGVDVSQTMWQAVRARNGKIVWWEVFRTEEDAREALEAAGLSE